MDTNQIMKTRKNSKLFNSILLFTSKPLEANPVLKYLKDLYILSTTE